MTFSFVTGAIAFYQGTAIGAAILAVAAYEISTRAIRKENSDLRGVIEAGVSAVGFVIGAHIFVICCSHDDLGPFKGDDRIYIALGGIALMWLAWEQVRELIWPKPSDE